MSDVLNRLYASLDIAVLAHLGDRRFTLLSAPPAWLTALWPEVARTPSALADASLFLDDFLDRAIGHWEERPATPLGSGVWSETRPDGSEQLLEATALCMDGQPILLLRIPPEQEAWGMYQQAREQRLAYEQMLAEINKREILLHCIVHDLSNPLAGIRGSLTLMARDALVAGEEGEELLRISLNQAEKMQRLVRSILHTFSDDVQPLVPALVTAERAPDAAACARNVAASLSATSALRGVAIEVEAPASAAGWRVAGEGDRLERVFFNLVANALRYATEGETITIRLAEDGSYIRAEVLDEGPGVAPERQEHLFRRFEQGDDRPGLAGLGLYYCRLTVEQWGGDIGYETRPEGGALFWMRLPVPRKPG